MFMTYSPDGKLIYAGPDERAATLARDTDGLRNQRDLLAAALGKVLVHYGIVRADAELTGPELLLAAETAVEGK
jgi:hypothetical protein